MKQGMRDHWVACGRTYAFLSTYAFLTGRSTLSSEASFWLSLMNSLVSPADLCEAQQLFLQGWQAEKEQAQEAWETGDLAIFEDVGRSAGFTSRRLPRNYRGITPARDGIEGNICGEALKCFVAGWRQTAAEALRKRGV